MKEEMKPAEGQARAIGDPKTIAGSRWRSKTADN